MKLKGAFIYLGVDTFTSKDNKVYKSACFLQNTDVQKVFLTDDGLKLVESIPLNAPVDVEFDIRLGQKSFACVDNLKKSSENGDMITESEILALQCNNGNPDNLITPSRKFRKIRKKMR